MTYTNQAQGVSNPTEASIAAPDQAQMPFTAPGQGVQDPKDPNTHQPAVGKSPILAAVQPQPQDPTIRISVADGLRHLADRYVNNPDSVVGVVRLEPGPSGGFQVVIILEVADLL